MSEQEKKSGSAAESSVFLVEQNAPSRHKQAFRPIDMQEDAPKEVHQKRSKAPAVPSVTEELKDTVNTDSKGQTESDRAMTSDKHKQNVAKKLSSVSKRRASSPETITLAPLSVEIKKDSATPIPAQVSPAADSSLTAKHTSKRKDDEDSIGEDISDLRGSELAKVSSEWSDEEEAGGLPRSESRASRVSRAVRQLFCCGVALEPPTEHTVSPRTDHDGV